MLPEQPHLGLIHFTAAAKMLSQAGWTKRSPQTLALARFLAEVILYWITSLCLLDSGLDPELRSLGTKWYEELLRPLPSSSQLHHELSPLLAGTYEIFALTLDITLFGRENISSHTRQVKVEERLQKLSWLQLGYSKFLLGLPQQNIRYFTQVCDLFLLTLKIFLMKIQTQELRSSHPLIQAHVSGAIAALPHVGDTPLGYATPLWPLVVLFCAVENRNQVQTLDGMLASVAPGTPKAQNIWQSAAIERIENHRKLNKEQDFQDGLSLLVCDSGILGSSELKR